MYVTHENKSQNKKKKKQNPTSFSISTRFTGNKFLYFQQEVVTVSILNQFHCNSVFPLLPKNVQSPYLYHPRSGSNKYTRILNIYIYMFSFCFCFNVRINRTSPYISSTMYDLESWYYVFFSHMDKFTNSSKHSPSSDMLMNQHQSLSICYYFSQWKWNVHIDVVTIPTFL